MALAQAIMSNFRFTGSLAAFVATVNMQHIHVLEINEAGNLTAFLSQVPHYTLAMYPAVDMQRLPYPDQSFDLIVHSDTLEHVADPMTALAECRRVLRPQGICAFTIPTIVGRLTRSRTGLPPSYHGAPGIGRDDYIVHTEYGADAWTQVIMAGFTECRIVTLEYPAGIALVAA
jgi:SAM-dependent methyltransferase